MAASLQHAGHGQRAKHDFFLPVGCFSPCEGHQASDASPAGHSCSCAAHRISPCTQTAAISFVRLNCSAAVRRPACSIAACVSLCFSAPDLWTVSARSAAPKLHHDANRPPTLCGSNAQASMPGLAPLLYCSCLTMDAPFSQQVPIHFSCRPLCRLGLTPLYLAESAALVCWLFLLMPKGVGKTPTLQVSSFTGSCAPCMPHSCVPTKCHTLPQVWKSPPACSYAWVQGLSASHTPFPAGVATGVELVWYVPLCCPALGCTAHTAGMADWRLANTGFEKTKLGLMSACLPDAVCCWCASVCWKTKALVWLCRVKQGQRHRQAQRRGWQRWGGFSGACQRVRPWCKC